MYSNDLEIKKIKERHKSTSFMEGTLNRSNEDMLEWMEAWLLWPCQAVQKILTSNFSDLDLGLGKDSYCSCPWSRSPEPLKLET